MARLPIITARRNGKVYGHWHDVHRSRDSVTDTKTQIIAAVDAQLRLMRDRYYRMAADGTVFCMYYVDGWQYDIFGAGHAKRGYESTNSMPQDMTRDDALAAMERHVAHYADPSDRKTA